MQGSLTIVHPASLLAMLALFALGLGVGPLLGGGPPADQGVSVPAPVPAPGIDLTRHTNVIVPGAPGARGSLSVACPSGTVVGGGFSAGRNLRVVESRPHGIREWRISWLQTSADDTVAYAYAVCMTAAVPVMASAGSAP